MTPARAYLVDGNNGTRSGPIRDWSETAQLERDRVFLENNAQGFDYSSGIARPGNEFWTDLPPDSIFPK